MRRPSSVVVRLFGSGDASSSSARPISFGDSRHTDARYVGDTGATPFERQAARSAIQTLNVTGGAAMTLD